MRTKTFFWLLLCVVIGVSSTALGQSSRERHVVLISIDGLAAFHLVDQSLELPNIRGLIEKGSWFASSQTVFPSVTHPSHTTMTTGVFPKSHGVVNNQLRNRETGESFHVTNLPRNESVKVPTLFDAAKKAGMKTAAFFWPETRDDQSIDYNIPEVFDQRGNAEISATDPAFIKELQDAGIPVHLYFEWYGDRHRKGAVDLILADAAAYTLKKYRPHLTAIHVLATDAMQHTFGPQHYLARNALTVADAAVGILVKAAAEANLLDRTTFIVTADHGFATVD
ncbi:MAG TPA: ectonucleotide pyrophosphatase/phosphodiesterase, partial [Acidobacteriota bacterium]|nr:ectonucleotide pyrophosphatase/phosphodiesterase [Acidobacteriota bacterium]